ncbi:hypothetical protein [Methylocystis sp.]|uniref:hypothetical protein n=1 Tax=Methylocystis sp. TaxID=1911079 RepID=UPI0025DA062C|nr:hypothetical protein [Methylocystis sp.]
MDKNFADVLEALEFIKERMATKDDLAELRDELRAEFKGDIAELGREMTGEIDSLRTEMQEGFASIRGELRDIRQRLEALEEMARNSSGLTKEIDHLMERVRAIEKHLDIKHKLAA